MISSYSATITTKTSSISFYTATVTTTTSTATTSIFLLQSNFSGSNTFLAMKISSRQGKFEPMRADYSARSGGLIGTSF